MEEMHGRRKKQNIVDSDESDDDIVELTCRACDFEGKSSSDIMEHSSKHNQIKCSKSDYTSISEANLRSHEQSTHMEIRVEIPVIPKQRPSMIACTHCEYTCKLSCKHTHTHVTILVNM